MILQTENRNCPCGSGKSYSECCRPFHRGEPAPTPEALMRSRYVAFVLNLPDYLRTTWHRSTRPEALTLEDSPGWASLQILTTGESGESANVHFRAIYRLGEGWGCLEENSDFVREQGRWYYLRGDTSEGPLKPGRNEPCPCGSGRKHKACCL
ncbi:SEC-C motif-containing protein [Marinobacter sp. es.048]|uniref:YchJ family protein n=1 Tax=Marinobacter sp. es.048 TaxID=1761795 RepID=UPI000B6C62AD|nr:YchJ family protein [Marinobacter sp. es.048]SNC60072.1 SEC-C motif-containing protein [Marinobacter sp. es.048]